MIRLRTAALVLALAWPGLALGQAHPGAGTPNFASMSADGAITAGGLLSGATLGITGLASSGTLNVTGLASTGTLNVTGLATSGTLSVGGTGPATGLGSAIGQVPLITSYRSSGRPGIVLSSGGLIFGRGVPTASDNSDILVQRNIPVVGGTFNSINSTLRVDTGPGVADNTAAWAFLSSMRTAQQTGADALGSYIQAWRLPGGNAHVWGEVVEVTDQTGLSSSAVGNPTLSMEIDLGGSDADDNPNPNKFGGIGYRHFIHFAANRWSGSALHEITTGLWFAANDSFSYIDSVIGFGNNNQIRNALDTRGAIPPTGVTDPVAAVRMSAGHIIDFKGGAALDSPPGNYLWYDSGSSRWKYTIAGVDKFSIDASGNVRAAGTVTGSTTP